MGQARKTLNAAIAGLGDTQVALSTLYTSPELAPDDLTLVRESYATVARMYNQLKEVRERTQ